MYCCLSLHQQALKLNLLKELCPCLQQTLEHCKEIIKWKISSPKTMTPMSDLEVRLINKKCLSSVQFSSVTQSRPTLCDPMNRSTPGLPAHHQFPESTKPMSIELVMPSNHLIFCRPLFLLPSIFPSIRVFSNE